MTLRQKWLSLDTVTVEGDGTPRREEQGMFEVTDKASEMIKTFLKDHDGTVQSIRIMMSGGG